MSCQRLHKRKQRPITLGQSKGGNCNVRKDEETYEEETHEERQEEILMPGKGLYANIHAKRKRIKAGSGEKMRKPGSKGAPTAKAFKQSAKTARKK
jgi:hypothetical protein